MRKSRSKIEAQGSGRIQNQLASRGNLNCGASIANGLMVGMIVVAEIGNLAFTEETIDNKTQNILMRLVKKFLCSFCTLML
jgi:hypothetical protein